MKRSLLFIALLFLLIGSSFAWAQEWQHSPKLEKLFKEAQIRGTFVLYDVSADTLIGHDHDRARSRFFPASTFKIPNTLIGLSVQAVESVDEVLPYGGQKQPIPSWEKNMGLRDAIKISSIPIYQELARRIGLANMREGISRLNYGNADIGDVVDIFWLEGPLKISAIEQTLFLAGLAMGTLPFPPEAQKAVREIIKTEEGDGWTLYAKTGTAARVSPKIGWWVGWVEKAGQIYPFAINLDIRKPEDANQRIELGKACLKALGIL